MMRGLYSGAERWFDAAPKHLLFEPLVEGKRVLEIDCGSGYGASLLARSAREVIGLCAEDADLTAARASAPQSPRAFQRLTPGDLPFVDGTFDVVLALRGADSFGGLDVLAREAHRILKPSGFFCVASQNPGKRSLPDALHRSPAPKRSVGFYELQRRMKSQFHHVKMLAQSPFFGFAFVDYSPDDLDAFSLDTSLLPEGTEDPTSFLALCGKLRLPPVNFSLIQLPTDGLLSLADQLGRAAQVPAPQAAPAVDPAEIARLKSQRAQLLRAKEEWERKANEATQRLRKAKGQDPAALSALEQERDAHAQAAQRAAARAKDAEHLLAESKEREQKLSSERLRLERSTLEFMGKSSELAKELKEKEERISELLGRVVRITNMERELRKQITEGRFTEKNLQTNLERREDELRESERRLERAMEETKAREESLRTRTEELSQENAALAQELASLRAQESQRHEEAARGAVATAEQLAEARAQAEAEARAHLSELRAQLADQEYILAEAVSRRVEADWRAEEFAQEVALARTGQGSVAPGELEGRLESARRELYEANLRASRADEEARAAKALVTAREARIEELSGELEGAGRTRAELEAALEDAERRSAAARERALVAAKDAVSARQRASKLEEELAAAAQSRAGDAQEQQSRALEEERRARVQEQQAAARDRSLLASRIAQLEAALSQAVRERVVNKPAAPVAPPKPERLGPALALVKMLSPRREVARLRASTRRQAALLRRASGENAALKRELATRTRPLSARPSAPVPAPPPAPVPAPPAPALAKTAPVTVSATELAAARAALEASRLARAEADRQRALSEGKLKDALARAQSAEEALAKAQAEIASLRKDRA
jgi:SAM-dependent methyltransferase